MFSARNIYVIFGNIFACGSLMGRYCSHSLTRIPTTHSQPNFSSVCGSGPWCSIYFKPY